MGASPLVPDDYDFSFDLTVLHDVKNMPEIMATADFAYTSAGRTIIELIDVGTPAICMAQNEKEMHHNHAINDHGILNLGLGYEISSEDLDRASLKMIEDKRFRHNLKKNSLLQGDKRNNKKTIYAIFNKLGLSNIIEF